MTTRLPHAPLWRRLAALVYDSFLLFGLLMAYMACVLLFEILVFGKDAVEASPTAGGNLFAFAGIVGVITGFYCFFWLRNRQTLGMQSWRLQIETEDGSPLTLRHCLLRAASSLLSLACLGAGYWWCLLPGKGTWHDTLSGTRITVHDKRSG